MERPPLEKRNSSINEENEVKRTRPTVFTQNPHASWPVLLMALNEAVKQNDFTLYFSLIEPFSIDAQKKLFNQTLGENRIGLEWAIHHNNHDAIQKFVILNSMYSIFADIQTMLRPSRHLGSEKSTNESSIG